jgi:hypothetical protein
MNDIMKDLSHNLMQFIVIINITYLYIIVNNAYGYVCIYGHLNTIPVNVA